MNNEAIINVKLERLNEQINELREVLNEICASSDGDELGKDILIISQCLDELIVQYMNHIKCQASDK